MDEHRVKRFGVRLGVCGVRCVVWFCGLCVRPFVPACRALGTYAVPPPHTHPFPACVHDIVEWATTQESLKVGALVVRRCALLRPVLGFALNSESHTPNPHWSPFFCVAMGMRFQLDLPRCSVVNTATIQFGTANQCRVWVFVIWRCFSHSSRFAIRCYAPRQRRTRTTRPRWCSFWTLKRHRTATPTSFATVPATVLRFVASTRGGLFRCLVSRSPPPHTHPFPSLAHPCCVAAQYNSDITDRTFLDSPVSWTPGPWTTNQNNAGTQSPDLASLFPTVVRHPQWAPNNHVVIAVTPGTPPKGGGVVFLGRIIYGTVMASGFVLLRTSCSARCVTLFFYFYFYSVRSLASLVSEDLMTNNERVAKLVPGPLITIDYDYDASPAAPTPTPATDATGAYRVFMCNLGGAV